ncbi:DNA-directed primase/polymerase protein isoform X1 [Parasteatoda tepidariorum]|uniref:DNA-directed primase/polymerase protein isoform X1 n=2 Tax=Parasteatoda tepidariorum TaxID=114398 RepID=UPI001C721F9C|nr:DNA-directed primase/polymerase protein isoform X1 [Parasteatoda tepidariorum]
MEHFDDSNVTDDFIAKQFYGPTLHASRRNWSESILHLRKIHRELQSKPIPSVFKSRLEGPSTSWKVFKRLSLAASFADSGTKDCMIFSFEERNADHTGQRLFLVTHPYHLWLNYKSRPSDERCTYEVIRENFPCKLYFDLEFNKILNPAKDGNDMTKLFIQCVTAEMSNVHGIHLQESNFLWLDASTDTKFSSHLIVQTPGAVFQNNVIAGSFVSSLSHKIISKIASSADSDQLWPSSSQLKSLIILKADEKKSFFWDSSVYTKNRNFRLFLSTKLGKRAPLVVSKYNQYVPAKDVTRREFEELMFCDSLVTYFRKNVQNLRVLSSSDSFMMEASSREGLSFKSRSSNFGLSNNGPSPFPEIDDFVLSQVNDHRITGFIRKWSYIEKEEILVYEIGNYRYCSNIGRHHKSNNIMLIVDLRKKHYYQKCHDPECRAENYKSVAISLPLSLYLPEDFFDVECFSQLKSEQTETLSNSENSEKKEDRKVENFNDILVEDSFFEDSFPFTQLNPAIKEDSVNTETYAPVQHVMEDSNSLQDINFDDASINDFESDDMTERTDSKAPENNNVYLNSAIDENFFNEDTNELSKENSNSDLTSDEDEIITAEAAAMLECSFTCEDIMSEETIF